MNTVRRISSSEAARRIGVRTNTLARWRSQGKGPTGAIRLSGTHVVYTVAAVEAFLRERKEAGRFLGQPPRLLGKPPRSLGTVRSLGKPRSLGTPKGSERAAQAAGEPESMLAKVGEAAA